MIVLYVSRQIAVRQWGFGLEDLGFLLASVLFFATSRDNLHKYYVAMAVLLDTHRLVNVLTERGFTAQQAEAITDAISEIDLSGLATKTDLAELEARLTVRMATFIGIGVAVQSAIIAAMSLYS